MLEAIAKPFGWLMLHLYNWIGNYGVAIILFALVVKLILLPFQLKSKKSMMRMSRMTPRLKELEKKFGNDQQRYQQEMQKLYKEEGVNPMSGCLWSLLPFPILLALYRAIRFPLTTMMGVPQDLLSEGGAITRKLAELGYAAASGRGAAYEQIFQSQFITEHFEAFAGLSDKLQALSYRFLGLDLGSVPQFAFWKWDWSSPAVWGPALGLFMIPIVSAVLSWLSMKIANATNPQAQAQTQQQSQTMMLMMPLMSIWICFAMPAIMGIYWIAQYVFGIAQDVVLTKVFNKQLDIEDADRIEREKARAAELEAKRAETERLKAEGLTVANKNTSKKKQQAAAAQKEAERKAAEIRAERAAKRAAMGIVDDIPDSQVGNRRYARGRAYVADRYTNPDEAEAKTILAAEESEAYAAEEAKVMAEAAEAVELTAGTDIVADEVTETEDDLIEEAEEVEEIEEPDEAEEPEELDVEADPVEDAEPEDE